MSTEPYEKAKQFADDILGWLKAAFGSEARVFPFKPNLRTILIVENKQAMVAVIVVPGDATSGNAAFVGYVGESDETSICCLPSDPFVQQKIVQGVKAKLADVEGYKRAKATLEEEQREEQAT